jgi:uncharacterized protein YkwD
MGNVFRLWLYIVIIALLALTALIVYALPSTPRIVVSHGGSRPPSYPHESLNREAIIGFTNEMRSARGLPSLTENRLLDAVAEARAGDMLQKQYFAHISPSGEQASDLAQRVGYPYRIIAENIASGVFLTNQKLVDGWMQSPGHRENILSPTVKEIGAAIVKGVLNGQETYVSVQIFGLQSPPVEHKACASPSEELLGEIETKKSDLESRNETLMKTKHELDTEADAIDGERKAVWTNIQDVAGFNARVKVYNEKSNEYNQALSESRVGSKALQSLVEQYNRQIKAYNSCQKSE